MTKYRRARQAVANVIEKIIRYASQMHVQIDRALDHLEQDNITVWKKMAVWSLRIYARVLPRNGDKENDGSNQSKDD